MKWVFVLCLLLLGAIGGAMGLIVGFRWMTSMQADVKVVPGEMPMTQPAGTVPRTGGELVVAREAYQARANPVARTPASLARGKQLFEIFCTPCHGAGGKGDGPVTPRFIPPPDLTGPQIQQQRTDGQMSYYIGYGGALMPAYGEALSVQERWDIVNYVRTLAQK